MLFNICVSDMDCKTLSKFENNINLFGEVDTLEGREAMQRGLDKLERWHSGPLVKFNKAKYKVPHLGQGIPKHEYRLGDE